MGEREKDMHEYMGKHCDDIQLIHAVTDYFKFFIENSNEIQLSNLVHGLVRYRLSKKWHSLRF